jgi:hypothetical protein
MRFSGIFRRPRSPDHRIDQAQIEVLPAAKAIASEVAAYAHRGGRHPERHQGAGRRGAWRLKNIQNPAGASRLAAATFNSESGGLALFLHNVDSRSREETPAHTIGPMTDRSRSISTFMTQQ